MPQDAFYIFSFKQVDSSIRANRKGLSWPFYLPPASEMMQYYECPTDLGHGLDSHHTRHVSMCLSASCGTKADECEDKKISTWYNR